MLEKGTLIRVKRWIRARDEFDVADKEQDDA